MLTANDWFRAYMHYRQAALSPSERAIELLLTKALALQLPGEIEPELDFIDSAIVHAYETFVFAVRRGERPDPNLPV